VARFSSISLNIQSEMCVGQISGDIQPENLKGVFQLGFTYSPQVLLMDITDLDNQRYFFSQSEPLSDLVWLQEALSRFEPWELQEGVLRSPQPATTRMSSIIQAIHSAKRPLVAA